MSTINNDLFNVMIKPVLGVFHKDLTTANIAVDSLSEEKLCELFLASVTKYAKSSAPISSSTTAATASTTTSKKAVKAPVAAQAAPAVVPATSSNAVVENVVFAKGTNCFWANCTKKCNKIRPLEGKVYCSRHHASMCKKLGIKNDLEDDIEVLSVTLSETTLDLPVIKEEPQEAEVEEVKQAPVVAPAKKAVKKAAPKPAADKAVEKAVEKPVEQVKKVFSFINSPPMNYESAKNSEFWKLVPFGEPEEKLLLNPETNLIISTDNDLHYPTLMGHLSNGTFIKRKDLDVCIISWVRMSNIYVPNDQVTSNSSQAAVEPEEIVDEDEEQIEESQVEEAETDDELVLDD